MILLSRPSRTPRKHEWSNARAVTFIVTLAATRSVTLAARAAGMSRKAAYALRGRDPRFAEAWDEAVTVPPARAKGNEVYEVDGPPIPRIQGDTRGQLHRAAKRARHRRRQERLRDRYFARLAAARPALPALDLDLLPQA